MKTICASFLLSFETPCDFIDVTWIKGKYSIWEVKKEVSDFEKMIRVLQRQNNVLMLINWRKLGWLVKALYPLLKIGHVQLKDITMILPPPMYFVFVLCTYLCNWPISFMHAGRVPRVHFLKGCLASSYSRVKSWSQNSSLGSSKGTSSTHKRKLAPSSLCLGILQKRNLT